MKTGKPPGGLAAFHVCVIAIDTALRQTKFAERGGRFKQSSDWPSANRWDLWGYPREDKFVAHDTARYGVGCRPRPIELDETG
jgi:hypothetical protein